MRQTWRQALTGVAVMAAVFAGSARAQVLPPITAPPPSTTSTSTSTTTTTTLLPHAFSPATAACIQLARQHSKECVHASTGCQAKFQTAFANCFAIGAGVKCAGTCLQKETTCIAGAPGLVKPCRLTCRLTYRRDVRSCHTIADGDNTWAAGDQGCLQTAASNLDLCKFVCTEPVIDCKTNFDFCIADCTNL